MDYAQYKKLKEGIEADHKKKLEALEMVWRMCQQQQNYSDSKEGGTADRNSSIADTIRKVIEGLSGDFSVNDVEQGLKDHNVKRVKRIAITNTLHRLNRRGELEIVKKGQGRMPGIFRKKLQEASMP